MRCKLAVVTVEEKGERKQPYSHVCTSFNAYTENLELWTSFELSLSSNLLSILYVIRTLTSSLHIYALTWWLLYYSANASLSRLAYLGLKMIPCQFCICYLPLMLCRVREGACITCQLVYNSWTIIKQTNCSSNWAVLRPYWISVIAFPFGGVAIWVR